MIRIEYSSMCLNELNYRDKINQAQAFVQAQGFDFGIQIHNSIDKSLYDKLIEFKGAIPFSVHSPVFSRYFLNLASTDFSIIQECSDTCIRYLNDLNTDLFFFHGFFMTEKPIVHDMKNYRRTIREGIGDSYCLNGSFIMEPTFFNTDTFQKYKTIFQKNFTNFKQRYSDFTIALENDFPGIGSGLQRPAEINELIDNLWFDLGHFWTSSLLHEFDFHDEAFKLLETKNVVGVHLNHNLVTHSDPKEKIRDSHTHFYLPSTMNLKPIVRKIFEKNISPVVLEIVDGDLRDIETLLDWIE